MIKSIISGFAALAFATTTAINTAAADDLSNMTWDEIIAQGKQEGQVTFSVWYLQDAFRNAVKPFEEEYGISVNIPDGTRDAFNNKLLAEAGQEKGDIDVFAANFAELDALGLNENFVKLDALPADEGRVTKLAGSDGQGFAVAYWGNQTGISYDPAKVAEEDLPQTPEDLAEFWAANPGKFGFNYIKGGSGQSFYQNILRSITNIDLTDGNDDRSRIADLEPGFEFFRKHAENYVVTASNGDSITRVSDGELWMAPGWEDHVAGLQKRGEIRKEIRFYVPSMGMNGGGNGVAIPKNAQNKAAALVFINWLTSAETQTAFNTNFGTAPMHANADDSNALVSNDQRAYTQPWGAQPFRKMLDEAFIENVIQER
ncbi:MAG: extracellular solute-binding protein [Rhizobiaceae bacterium]